VDPISWTGVTPPPSPPISVEWRSAVMLGGAPYLGSMNGEFGLPVTPKLQVLLAKMTCPRF